MALPLNLHRIRRCFERWRAVGAGRLRPPYARQRYVHMFIDDVANSLVPFRGTPNVDFRVKLKTSPPSAIQLVQEAFGDRSGCGFDEAVADFFRDSARTILTNYDAIYCLYVKDTYSGHPVKQSFIITEGDPSLFTDIDETARTFRTVPIYLPRYIRSKYPKIIRKPVQLSGEILPKFAKKEEYTKLTLTLLTTSE